MSHVEYQKVVVNGLEIFYRDSGPRDAPALLLLHGFPSAGHMFRDLIPLLNGQFRLVAPDLPGFGQSSMPMDDSFKYTFDNVANVIDRFTEVVGLKKFGLYVFDYGAPVGLRLALKHPERISAVISQNGNVYEEGLSGGWDSLKEYWRAPTDSYRESLKAAFTLDATRYQYTQGAGNSSRVSPDGIALDQYYLNRPGAHIVQLSFFLDYGSNVRMYPKFQEYMRNSQIPVLAVWGKNDPYFLPVGAESFKRDVPNADVRLYDAGHFALETHALEISEAIKDFWNNSFGFAKETK